MSAKHTIESGTVNKQGTPPAEDRNEKAYQLLFENAPVGMFLTTFEEGRVLAANRVVRSMLALDEDQEDQSMGAYVQFEDQERIKALLKANGAIENEEVQLRRKDGGMFWASVSARLYPEHDYIEGVVVDVTDQRRAQEMLQERLVFEEMVATLSTRFIHITAGQVDDAIQDALRRVGEFIDVDRGYVYQYDTGPGLLRHTHHWEREGIQSIVPRVRVVRVDNVPWLMRQLNEGVFITFDNPSQVPEEAEPEVNTYRMIDVQSMVMVPMVFGGSLVGVLGFESVREPRTWSNDLPRLINLVGGVISSALKRKEVETTLIRAKEQAEEIARIRTAFLANMSHEIRTPLTSILGFSSLLAEEVMDKEQLEYVTLIRQSGRRLMDTLNSVLDLAQLESHEQTISLGIFNITSQVAEVVRLLKPLADEKNLELELISSAPDAMAEIDQACLHRILNNLISNGIKFTNSGGVTVYIRADEEQVFIQVQDTGIGMTDDFVPHMFEAFRQESDGLTRSHEGSGLGLTITRRLVDLMGGTIGVESKRNMGTTFSVSFARVYPASIDDDTDWPSDPEMLKMPSVLVVEDNWETRMLLQHMLRASYEVDLIDQAEQAIQRVKRQTYDIVLMDINLGGEQTGIDVLGAVRQYEGDHKTLVIALTAYALPGDQKRFMKHGFDGYLGKPFARTELLKMLKRLIAEKD